MEPCGTPQIGALEDKLLIMTENAPIGSNGYQQSFKRVRTERSTVSQDAVRSNRTRTGHFLSNIPLYRTPQETRFMTFSQVNYPPLSNTEKTNKRTTELLKQFI